MKFSIVRSVAFWLGRALDLLNQISEELGPGQMEDIGYINNENSYRVRNLYQAIRHTKCSGTDALLANNFQNTRLHMSVITSATGKTQ